MGLLSWLRRRRREDATTPPAPQLPAADAEPRGDDWKNVVTGFGVLGRDKRLGATFELTNDEVVTKAEAEAIWAADDVGARIICDRPQDEMREGWNLELGAKLSDADRDDLHTRVTKRYTDLGLEAAIVQARCYERAYGGGAVLLGIDDGRMPFEPVDPDRAKGISWINDLEGGRDGMLRVKYTYTNPLAPKYGRPEVYEVIPEFQGQSRNFEGSAAPIEVHESRLLIFGGVRVSTQRTANNCGWGESILTRVRRVLRDYGIAWSAAGILLKEFASTILKMKHYADIMARKDFETIEARLAAMHQARSLAGMTIVDADEELTREVLSITGMPELLELFMYRIAAAAETPHTKLFGRSAAGMNASGEGDLTTYYDTLRPGQRRVLAPAITYATRFILRGEGYDEDGWKITFPSLWQPSAKEASETRLNDAKADHLWIGDGVVAPEEVAISHWGGETYSPEIAIDFENREALEADDQLDDPPPEGDEDLPAGNQTE